jgi:DNA topoisomerase-1
LKIIFSEFASITRVSFNEITKKAVTDALNNSRDIDMNLVKAALVRRFMDRLVGYRCSKFCRSWKLRSMGRVQTPALGFVVDRELEREAHVPKEYHSVSVDSNDVNLKVKFHEKTDPESWTGDDGKHHPNRTSNSKLANSTYDALRESDSLTIESVGDGRIRRRPRPPFTTDTMLQSANSNLGWSISKTSGVASSLYQAGHITYIRTDSTRTNAEARESIRDLISKTFGANHLGSGVGESEKSSKSKVQDAHEAIRPTDPNVEAIKSDKDEGALYSLVWARFAASQMSDSIRERRQLVMSCEGLDLPLYGTSSWRTHAGWEAAFSKYMSNVATKPPKSGFIIGSAWAFDGEPILTTDVTKPPRRFSESSIILQMKSAGIGRPSTYVSTVTKLVDRDYVDKDSRTLSPTSNGRLLWLDVVPHYNEDALIEDGLFTSEFTSSMEESLDKIEFGNADAATTWDDFVDVFRGMHNNALERRRKKPTLRQLQYLDSMTSRMSEEEKHEIIGVDDIGALSGDEIRRVIDSLSNQIQGGIPASEKQVALIIRLADKLAIDLDAFLKEQEIIEIDSLTGGRDGTASEIIDKLIILDNSSPATERQISTVRSMSENLGLTVEEAVELVRSESIETLAKMDASSLIGILKKQIQSKRRGK